MLKLVTFDRWLKYKEERYINMKTRTFFYVLLVAVIFCGCCNNSDTRLVLNTKTFDIVWSDNNGSQQEEQFTVIEIDSCEYLTGQYDRSRFLTHKGNCKFCAERSKK